MFVATGQQPRDAAVLGLAVALSSSVVIVNIVRSRRRRTDRATEAAMLTWSVLQDVCGVLLAAVLLSFAGVSDRPPALALAGPGRLPRRRGRRSLAAPACAAAARRRARPVPDRLHRARPGPGRAGCRGLRRPRRPGRLHRRPRRGRVAGVRHGTRQLVPFRDVFAVLFFVSVGTLINPAAVVAGLPWLGLILARPCWARSSSPPGPRPGHGAAAAPAGRGNGPGR